MKSVNFIPLPHCDVLCCSSASTFALTQFSGVGSHKGSLQSAIVGGARFDGVGIDAETAAEETEGVAVVESGRVMDVVEELSTLDVITLLLVC